MTPWASPSTGEMGETWPVIGAGWALISEQNV
jgi:hypothetical protein